MVSLVFRLKNRWNKNDLLEEIKHNDLMSKKDKNVCRVLSYFEHFLVFISEFSGYVSMSAFTSSVVVPLGITSSAVGIKICATTAGIKKYKSITKEQKKKHDKIVMLQIAKLDITEVLMSKTLIDSYIIHDEFVSVNNVLLEYNDMKEQIINLENAAEYIT